MNLNDILQNAQGGAGLQNLANQFGLSPDQTQSALQAIIPALSHGLQRAAQDPNALNNVVGQIASGAHSGSYTDPSQLGGAADAGAGALGQIFGSPMVTNQIAEQVARMSGLSPAIIAGLLPAVASMALGGLGHTMNAQGMGGALSQAAAPSGGGGLLGTLISMVTGGGGAGAAAGGLGPLINMFAPGMSVPPEHQQALNQILPR